MANEKNSSCCNRYGNGLERLHYPAIKELEDKYEIVALCNRTRKDAEEFAKKINLAWTGFTMITMKCSKDRI